MNTNETNSSTGQIPAVERMGLRTMEARIQWWVDSANAAARAAVVSEDAAKVAA